MLIIKIAAVCVTLLAVCYIFSKNTNARNRVADYVKLWRERKTDGAYKFTLVIIGISYIFIVVISTLAVIEGLRADSAVQVVFSCAAGLGFVAVTFCSRFEPFDDWNRHKSRIQG